MTTERRADHAIDNPSHVRATINAKLEALRDPRRVVCHEQPSYNRFGERGTMGKWSIV